MAGGLKHGGSHQLIPLLLIFCFVGEETTGFRSIKNDGVDEEGLTDFADRVEEKLDPAAIDTAMAMATVAAAAASADCPAPSFMCGNCCVNIQCHQNKVAFYSSCYGQLSQNLHFPMYVESIWSWPKTFSCSQSPLKADTYKGYYCEGCQKMEKTDHCPIAPAPAPPPPAPTPPSVCHGFMCEMGPAWERRSCCMKEECHHGETTAFVSGCHENSDPYLPKYRSGQDQFYIKCGTWNHPTLSTIQEDLKCFGCKKYGMNSSHCR